MNLQTYLMIKEADQVLPSTVQKVSTGTTLLGNNDTLRRTELMQATGDNSPRKWLTRSLPFTGTALGGAMTYNKYNRPKRAPIYTNPSNHSQVLLNKIYHLKELKHEEADKHRSPEGRSWVDTIDNNPTDTFNKLKRKRDNAIAKLRDTDRDAYLRWYNTFY